MAIVEEPFSIFRLLRSLGGRRDQPEYAAQADSEPADQVADEPPQAAQTPTPDETHDAEDGDLAEAALLGDPSLLSGFNYSVTRTSRTEDGYLWVDHLLVCDRCIAGDMFSIRSYARPAPDPSPDADEAPGDTAGLPPWSIKCIECGHRTTLVEADADGSNLGKPAAKGQWPVPDPVTEETGAAIVYVSLAYPRELQHVIDEAAEAGVPPADLYEAIVIRGYAPNGEKVFDGFRVTSADDEAD